MTNKSESLDSTDIPSISFISSNFDNLELARAKASESVVNLNQFFPEIQSEIKVYSDKFSLLGDNSENLENENILTTLNELPVENEVKIPEDEHTKESAVFSTELSSIVTEEYGETSKEFTFMPKSWTSKGLHSLPTMIQIIDTRASEKYAAGMIALKSGKWLEAISHFTHCIHLKPKEPSYYANRAEIFLQLTDFQSAILNYKRACILDPGNGDFFSRLAFLYVFQSQILFDQGLNSQALESVGRAIEMVPGNPAYHIRAIACLAALNRHSECLALINKQIDANNSNPDFFVLRAKLHSHFRNFSLCYYDLIDALNLDSTHIEARNVLENMAKQADNLKDLSVELALYNRLQESVSKISLAIDLNPIIGDYHVKRGAFYRRLKNFTAAIDDFIMAMDKVDHNEQHETYCQAQRQLILTFNDFAVECFEKSYFDEAIKLLNKAIQNEKSEPQFYINRGDCFFKQQQWEFALADYQQALSMTEHVYQATSSRIALVHFSVGYREFEKSNYKESNKSLTEAIKNNPFQSTFWNVRARCRYILEDFKGARKDVISGILLSGFDRNMESVFSRLFPNKSLSHVLDSKLTRVTRKELDRIIKEKQHNSTNGKYVNQKQENRKDKSENKMKIESCIIEEKLLIDCMDQYHELDQKFNEYSGNKNFIKKPLGNVTCLPDLQIQLSDQSNITGIVGNRDGKKFYMDNRGVIIRASEPQGWRKFKSGIEMK